MKNFLFQAQTRIIFGKKTIRRVGREMALAGHRSALVVSGRRFARESGLMDKVLHSLDKNDIQRREFSGVGPNPELCALRQGIDLAREYRPDAVLAVGGGSVIDAAKLIAAWFRQPEIWPLILAKRDVLKALPIYAVVTASGAGSEASPYAVASNAEQRLKLALRGPALVPRAAVIDPRVQFSLDWPMTVSAGFDAICHVLEQMITAEGGEPSLEIGLGVMRTLFESLELLRRDGFDYEARASLAWGSVLAQNGICGAGLGGGDWGAHVLAHALAAFNPAIIHGQALAVIAPAWIGRSALAERPGLIRACRALWNEDSPAKASPAISHLLNDWGLPTRLGQLGIGKNDLPDLIGIALAHGPAGQAAPPDRAELSEFLENLL